MDESHGEASTHEGAQSFLCSVPYPKKVYINFLHDDL